MRELFNSNESRSLGLKNISFQSGHLHTFFNTTWSKLEKRDNYPTTTQSFKFFMSKRLIFTASQSNYARFSFHTLLKMNAHLQSFSNLFNIFS